MKKTQCELIVEFFEQNGWKATLGQLLENGIYSYAHKLTARLSDLRAKGFDIKCEPGPNPSQNLYIMTPKCIKNRENDTYMFDSIGQGVLL